MNLVPLLYVGFRIVPFILISFFALSSILKSDVRGLIFLGMILINCSVVLLLDSFFVALGISVLEPGTPEDYKAMCNALSIGDNGQRIANIPMNINIVAFTFMYLVQLISKNTQINTNLHSVIFFTILLCSLIAWEFINGCASFPGICLALIIGAVMGIVLCEMIDSISKKNKIQLHFFTNVTNDTDVCKMTNEDLFECSTQ
jgi:hypothetical protein